MTKLGYIGVDIVIDRGKGPMVLEFDARPGLSIHTKSPSFAYLCCLLVILLDVLKSTPASIPRRRLDLLLNATWYQIANQAGLIARLGAGDHEDRESLSFDERIQLGQEIAYELHQKN